MDYQLTMKKALLFAGVLFGITAFNSNARADLAVGGGAQDLFRMGSDGMTCKLPDLKDKQAVVVAWHPLAFTEG